MHGRLTWQLARIPIARPRFGDEATPVPRPPEPRAIAILGELRYRLETWHFRAREAGAAGTAARPRVPSVAHARVVRETAEASSFVLDVPDELGSAFAYEAGQFCTFRVRMDGQPLSALLLHVVLPGGGHRTGGDGQADTRRGGVELDERQSVARATSSRSTRPAGVFRLGPERGRLVAFSAGSGITPVSRWSRRRWRRRPGGCGCSTPTATAMP